MSARRSALALLLLGPLLCAFPACGDEVAPPETVAPPTEVVPSDDAYGTCVAFKGNGPRFPAHFGALARLVEHHGLIGGVAGGSSGAISSYLVESVQANPAVYTCGWLACTPEQQAIRAAALFKSVPAFLQRLHDTDEARAFVALQRIADRVQDAGVPGLLTSNPIEGVTALRDILGSDTIRALVNEEAIDLLISGENRIDHARDLWEIASTGLAFTAPDERIFIVPGLLDFEELARRIGRVGSFYAGWRPVNQEAMVDFLDLCAHRLEGRTWAEAAGEDLGGISCQEAFDALLTDWYVALDAAPDASTYPNRVDQPIGATMPALATTAVLEGPSADVWRDARRDWLVGDEWALETRWQDVRAGWWGYATDRELVAANAAGFDDAKSRRAVDLGEATWLDVLAASPAEPGLARGIELPDGRISVGGWADPAPVQALRAVGCEQVAFVNRRGDTGWFVRAVSGHLGMDDADEAALWDLDAPGSGMWTALDDADAIWCADWDQPAVTNHAALFADGWNAPVASVAPFFTEAAEPMPTLVPFVDEEGCGVPPAVASAGTLSCGDEITANTADGSRVLDGYSCRPGNYGSPELSWLFVAPTTGSVTFELVDPEPNVLNHDVFVLAGEHGRAADCLEVGFNAATAEVEAGASYTVVVDGNAEDSVGAFTLRVVCE